MRRSLSLTALLVLTLASSAIAGNYVVVYKAQQIPSGAAAKIAANGGRVVRSLDSVGVAIVSGDDAFAARAGKDASVQAIGPEHMYALPTVTKIELADQQGLGTSPTSADVYYGYQWDIRRIGAPAAWTRYPLAQANAPTVAVLDVGVSDVHPDLAGKVILSKSTAYCTTAGGPGSTAEGFPSYAKLIDFDAHPIWTPDDGCSAAPFVDYEFHGTHVAGTVAASFGGGKVVGVAPDAMIAAYKVFDLYKYSDAKGTHYGIGAFDGPIFDAIIDVAKRGYPVINMSLGSADVRNNKDANASWLAWDRIAKFANRMGTLIVASAGNAQLNSNGTIFSIPSDLPTVVSVSATGSNNLVLGSSGYDAAAGSDTLTSYSNYGSAIDIAAPGGDCGDADCVLPQYFILNAGVNGAGMSTYYFAAGTSMAAPHVAAVAAEVLALHPDWTPGDVRSFLKSTAEAVGPRQFFGAGLVNDDDATK